MSTVPEIIRDQAVRQCVEVFSGNPNALDMTLAQLRHRGQSALYGRLLSAVIGAGPLLARVNQFAGNAPTDILEPGVLADRINAIPANSIGPMSSFANAIQPSDAVLDEPNLGAWLTTLPDGDVYGSYRAGNTRTLKWWTTTTRPKFVKVGGKTVRRGTTVTVGVAWANGSGPLCSSLSACIYNLGLLVSHEDVGDALTATLQTLIDDLANWQAETWDMADEIAALPGRVDLGVSEVPPAIRSQYPKGWATLSVMGGADIRI